MKMTCPQSIKFLKLKRRLRLPHWQVVGLLESLWLFTQMNAPRGDIGRLSNEDLAATIEWDGDADQLVLTLVECGFLDECEANRLVVHDWADHVPTYLKGALSKNNIEFAKHVAKQPAKHVAKHDAEQPAKQTQNDAEQPAPSLALARVVNSGVGIPMKDSSEPPSTAASKQTADEPIVESFPPVECVGKVKTWRMTQAKHVEWRESFSTIDVDLEIRKAYQWLRDNPEKRKTSSGMVAFLGKWLTRATNDNGGRSLFANGNGRAAKFAQPGANFDPIAGKAHDPTYGSME